MRRDVHAPARLVDPEPAQRARHRRLLRARRAPRASGAACARRASATSGGSACAERPEHTPQLGCAQPEVVVAEQPLVAALALLATHSPYARASSTLRSSAGANAAKSSFARAMLPALLAVGARSRALDRELFRHAARALPVAARQAHDVAIELVERPPPRRAASISSSHSPISAAVARSWVRRASVPSCCARAGAALGGHHHQLVPAGEHLDRAPDPRARPCGSRSCSSACMARAYASRRPRQAPACGDGRPRGARYAVPMEPTSAGELVKVATGGPGSTGSCSTRPADPRSWLRSSTAEGPRAAHGASGCAERADRGGRR